MLSPKIRSPLISLQFKIKAQTHVWYFKNYFKLYFNLHILIFISEFYQFQILSLSAQSVRESTHARVTIHYIPCPIASFPYCHRTKEIYESIKLLCYLSALWHFGNIFYIFTTYFTSIKC